MKTWEKPKLIALVRSKPEEAVLQNCKSEQVSGADTLQTMCGLYIPGIGCTAALFCYDAFST